MTLKNTILLAFAAVSVASASANAYITPGRPGPYPGPAPIPNPNNPGYPGNPGNPGYGQTIQRSVVLNTRVINSSIDVLQAVGIDYSFNGYQVESVIIDMRGSQPGTDLSLLMDGRITSSVYSPQGRVMLRPSSRAILGQDLRSLQISVRGLLDLTGITVNLVQANNPGYPGPGYPGPGPGPGHPGNPGNPGYSEKVDLGIDLSLYGNDRLDITRYIDMRRYRGYRIDKIEIVASSTFNTSLIDLMINGFAQGPSVQLDNRRRVVKIRPTQNAVLGQGADSIILMSRGDTEIHQVILRLSR